MGYADSQTHFSSSVLVFIGRKLHLLNYNWAVCESITTVPFCPVRLILVLQRLVLCCSVDVLKLHD